MKIAYLLLLAVILGGWSFFSPGTLSVAILSFVSLYIFSLSFKDKRQKKIIIGICAFALLLRFVLSIFNYYASWAMGRGVDFISDAQAYSADAQYITEVITQKPAETFDNNEPAEVPSLRVKYKGLLPPMGYRVDFFTRYIALVYLFFGYNPVTIKLINSLLSVITSIMLFILARKFFSIRTAGLVLALTLFWPSIVMWSVTGLKEPILIFFITLIIFIYLNYFKDSINNFEFITLFLIFAIRNYFLSMIFLFIFSLYQIFKAIKFKSPVLNAIIKPLLLLIAVKASFIAVGSIRSHLIIILLAALALSRISLSKKNASVFLLILFCIGIGLVRLPHLPQDKFNIKQSYNSTIRIFIDTQRNQQDVAYTAYKVYPDKYYGSALNISRLDLTFSYLRGLSYVLFSPFPFSALRNISSFSALAQSMIFYILTPFIILGIFIALRYKWREMSVFIFFITLIFSLYALVEGNMGTLFRHRDVAMIFLLIFAAIGINHLFRGRQTSIIYESSP